MKSPGQLFALLIVAVILVMVVGAGAWLLLDQMPKVLEGWRSRAWASTSATIERSAAVHQYTEGTGRRSGKATHVIDLQYSFVVGGQRHVGTRRSLDSEGKLSSADSAAKISAQLPAGRVLPVFYDPRDPRVSLLEPGVPVGGIMLSLFGVGLIAAVCIPLALMARKQLQFQQARKAARARW